MDNIGLDTVAVHPLIWNAWRFLNSAVLPENMCFSDTKEGICVSDPHRIPKGDLTAVRSASHLFRAARGEEQ